MATKVSSGEGNTSADKQRNESNRDEDVSVIMELGQRRIICCQVLMQERNTTMYSF